MILEPGRKRRRNPMFFFFVLILLAWVITVGGIYVLVLIFP